MSLAEIVLFGGTLEGRLLAQALAAKGLDALVCVATDYGESLLLSGPALRVQRGRLDRSAMAVLLAEERPRLVIDATHPYAKLASENIRAACEALGLRRLRLGRAALDSRGCLLFPEMAALVSWLEKQPGNIFSTLGAKEAGALARISGYQQRVWLRILPDPAGLAACLAAGFPAAHIICMQGPFSAALNAAMFREAKADILLSKESGAVGGYGEKRAAAELCNMTMALLARPKAEAGHSLDQLLQLIQEDAL